MEPLGGGDFEMATPPATTITNHLLGGRNPYLVLLWQKCLITEWFSWLIIKTALDRNQRVVITNTCVFSLTGLTLTFTSLPTHSKSKKSSIFSLKNVGSTATHNITIITGSDVIHSHAHISKTKTNKSWKIKIKIYKWNEIWFRSFSSVG